MNRAYRKHPAFAAACQLIADGSPICRQLAKHYFRVARRATQEGKP